MIQTNIYISYIRLKEFIFWMIDILAVAMDTFYFQLPLISLAL